MILNALILFFSALAGGLIEYYFPVSYKSKWYGASLTFAGAFLFALTVVHILPELFQSVDNRFMLGIFVLIGFFFQRFLESLSGGVEHGHMHHKSDSHSHNSSGAIVILIGLSIHSLMEGALVAHPSTIHDHHDTGTLLIGIALHKIPAAYALMSIISCYSKSRTLNLTYLLLFSLASPLGLIVSDWSSESNLISEEIIIAVFALVSGSFLNISTTIFIETSPKHKLNFRTVITAALGASSAILLEYLG